ncbi:MAG TPA: hypothetical protein VFQ43_08815 [Nitrososphaera sp.]|nr:hypothetical protein [Nitrososphaera sp.]
MRDRLTSSIEFAGESSIAKKVIYDIGANNGDDIPYNCKRRIW